MFSLKGDQEKNGSTFFGWNTKYLPLSLSTMILSRFALEVFFVEFFSTQRDDRLKKCACFFAIEKMRIFFLLLLLLFDFIKWKTRQEFYFVVKLFCFSCSNVVPTWSQKWILFLCSLFELFNTHLPQRMSQLVLASFVLFEFRKYQFLLSQLRPEYNYLKLYI